MACSRVIECEEIVESTAISPDGKLLAAGLRSGIVLLLDTRSGETRTRLQAGRFSGDAFSVAFSPCADACHQQLLAVGYNNNTVWVWDCSSGKCVAELRGHTQSVHRVTFSPDGRLLASACWDKTVRLWHTDDWFAPPVVLRGHADFVFGVAFSCDGRLLASCSLDHTVKLWHVFDVGDDAAAHDAPAAVEAASLALNAGQEARFVSFSPVDSRLLAFCGWPDVLVLARVRSGDGAIVVERKLQGHTNSMIRLAFSPCGQKLASTSCDQTVRLWSVASGACLRVLWGHLNYSSDVAFFPDGRQLASGSHDKTVRIWTLCAWSDKTHRLFGAPLKAAVFGLMCVRARLEQEEQEQDGQLPRLPMEVWLLVFGQLQLAMA